jgi:hypothetical protein
LYEAAVICIGAAASEDPIHEHASSAFALNERMGSQLQHSLFNAAAEQEQKLVRAIQGVPDAHLNQKMDGVNCANSMSRSPAERFGSLRNAAACRARSSGTRGLQPMSRGHFIICTNGHSYRGA